MRICECVMLLLPLHIASGEMHFENKTQPNVTFGTVHTMNRKRSHGIKWSLLCIVHATHMHKKSYPANIGKTHIHEMCMTKTFTFTVVQHTESDRIGLNKCAMAGGAHVPE